MKQSPHTEHAAQNSSEEAIENAQENSSAKKSIPANVRVMVALVASPTLLIIAFSVYSVLFADWKAPGISGIIFSALGIFAYYVVIVGRLPHWFKFKK